MTAHHPGACGGRRLMAIAGRQTGLVKGVSGTYSMVLSIFVVLIGY